MNQKVLHIDAADGTYGYPLSFNNQDKMIQIHRYNKGLDFLSIHRGTQEGFDAHEPTPSALRLPAGLYRYAHRRNSRSEMGAGQP